MTPKEKLEWCRTIKSLYAGRIVALVEEIKRANHRYADLQNICDDQDKEIKRLEEALVEERAKHVAASRLTDEQQAAISRGA